jgi:hypothetical protein
MVQPLRIWLYATGQVLAVMERRVPGQPYD